MKRPPELLLLSAVILGVVCHSVNGLRGTELVFRKTSTTSSTTQEPAVEAERRTDEEVTTLPETTEESTNVTKSKNFTGIPQIDYIFDPNLPRELNGYNLSSYPFFNGMPENINFKCDGLHDGFYASVEHKCQVYHHCLFGTRFDFLCANYTAFDQKTFICHFVSEVDCINSPKYWFRNDVLYQAASTTTVKPVPVVISPALTTGSRRPHPGVRRPKPPPRRRPEYDYYDEDYDEEKKEEDYEEPPPRRRRKRPRPRRPRPYYEDDYEEYEDERYDRRNPGRNREDNYRKHYDRREPEERDKKGSNRDDLEEDKITEERRKPNREQYDSQERRKPTDYRSRDEESDKTDRRKPTDYRSRDEESDKTERRKPTDDRNREEDTVKEERRKPTEIRGRDEEGRRKPTDYRNKDEGIIKEERRQPTDYKSRNENPVKDERRPSTDYRNRDDERKPPSDYRSRNEEERKKPTDYRNRDEDIGKEERRKPISRNRDENKPYDDRDLGDRYKSNGDERKPYDSRPEPNNRNVKHNKHYPDNDHEADEGGAENRHRGYDDSYRYDKGSDEPYRYDRDRRKGDDRKRRPFDDSVDENRNYGKRPYTSSQHDDRRPLEGASSYDSPRKSNRKPYDDFYDDEERDDKRSYDRPRKNNRDRHPQENNDRPSQDRPSQDRPSQDRPNQDRPSQDRPSQDRPKVNENKDKELQDNQSRGMVKPISSTSVFNQPRTAPKIKPPVPKSEQNKFAYKPTTEKIIVMKVEKEEEYYDDYEDEPTVELNRNPKPKAETRFVSPPTTTTSTTTTGRERDIENKKVSTSTFKTRVQTFRRPIPEVTDDYVDEKPSTRRPQNKPSYDSRESLVKSNNRNRLGASLVEKDEEPILRPRFTPPNRDRTTSAPLKELESKVEPFSTTTTVASKEIHREPVESFVKILKRPFLPSRGGNPYLPRGLQPVGAKSLENIKPLQNEDITAPAREEKPRGNFKYEEDKTQGNFEEQYKSNEDRTAYSPYVNEKSNPVHNNKHVGGFVLSRESPPPPPPPPTSNENTRQIYSQTNPSNTEDNEENEEIRPISNRPETVLRQHSNVDNFEVKNVERPREQEPERNPLDISEDEYDVTLNDALNPTIPNLPVRNFPSSYSNAATDYTYSNFQRSRYDAPSNQATENRYQQIRAPSQNVEASASNIHDSRKRYPDPYIPQTEQIYQNYRPASQITQAQTRGFYPLY